MATRLALADGDRVAGMETLASSRKLSEWETLFVGEMRKRIAAGEDLFPRMKAVLKRLYEEHSAKGELP